MHVKFALLADGANLSREGKLNILGTFDTIYARTFPTAHPHMQLVLRLEAAPEEAGSNRTLEVRLLDGSGRVLAHAPGTLAVQPQETGEAIRLDRIFTFTTVVFEAPGRYSFAVVVDGKTDATVPLRVEQLPVTH
jgi:hypothetical protein